MGKTNTKNSNGAHIRRLPFETSNSYSLSACSLPKSTNSEPERIHCRNPEARNGPKGSEIEHDGVIYQSASEVACGVLMQKYIPGFKVVKGESYEVPIGQNHAGGFISVDFLVRGVLLEYHPPKFQKEGGDFTSNKERIEHRQRINSAQSRKEKKDIRAETGEKLTKNYTAKRLEQIEGSSEHSGKRLIVASSPEDLYTKVIEPFGRMGRKFPSKAVFAKEFRTLRDEILLQAQKK